MHSLTVKRLIWGGVCALCGALGFVVAWGGWTLVQDYRDFCKIRAWVAMVQQAQQAMAQGQAAPAKQAPAPAATPDAVK